MAKRTGEKDLISEVIPELINCAAKLRNSEDRNCALRKELSEHKNAAASDRLLLASGLRLALANEALRVEIAVLRKAAAERAPGRKVRGGSPGRL